MDSRDDLAALLEQRRADPAFAERVRRRMAEDKAILDRLAESERSDDQAHRLALELARHQRVDPPHAHCTCDPHGEEVVRLGELFSKHLVEVILAAGWVPGELLAAEQARNATLTDTIQRVKATHTRAYTAGHGGTRIAYCEQDSEAAQAWVSWPCPTVCALSEEDG